MPWCTRDEVREVSAEAQEIFDDIGSGRLVIRQHAEDGWTTVAVGTYLNGKSGHLHGEDHLRAIETTYDTPAEALEDFKRRHGDAVRPGPAPATTTEETARLLRAGIHPAKAQRPHDLQPETFRTAGPGDHEALLGRSSTTTVTGTATARPRTTPHTPCTKARKTPGVHPRR
ncbi:hypothetical protein ACWV95_28625 [Streptomyces albus]